MREREEREDRHTRQEGTHKRERRRGGAERR